MNTNRPTEIVGRSFDTGANIQIRVAVSSTGHVVLCLEGTCPAAFQRAEIGPDDTRALIALLAHAAVSAALIATQIN